MKQLPEVASIYTAEFQVIFLALCHGIGTNGDTYIICVDSMSCLEIIETFDIEDSLVLSYSNISQDQYPVSFH